MTTDYYSQYKTGQTSELIDTLNGIISNHNSLEIIEKICLDVAAKLSLDNLGDSDNIYSREGGPFAAILLKYEELTDNDVYGAKIIGIGTNHVGPENDPSAHAEVSALRDAAKRVEHNNFSKTILFSSCECCPQCQIASKSLGIDNIVYSNTRYDAAAIGIF